tara:strand:- start:1071 stop:1979 length:909 start_codon:yes stop_codon:yes gene_type:complete
MGNIIHITYQGGTHGSYLTYCIDRYSELTAPITELPFSGGTSHKKIRDESKSFINQYHPNQNPKPYFKFKHEPHILITINEEDLLFIERWSTIRNNDYKVDTNADEIKFTPEFLQSFNWVDSLKKYYNINLQDTNYTVPRFIMRDWYKLSFLNPKENGFMQWQEKMLEYKPKNCFKFPVSAFWDMNKFITTMKMLNEHWNLKLRVDTEMEDIHKLFLKKVTFLSTKNRADDIIKAIKKNIDYDLSDIDTVEQAYISAWIEKNYKFVQVPLCNQFFKNTKEIVQWLKNYPEHYEALNLHHRNK